MLARLILATLYNLAVRTAQTTSMLLEQAAHRAIPAALGGLRRIRAPAIRLPAVRPGLALPTAGVALLAIGVVGALAVTTSSPVPAAHAAAVHHGAADHLAAEQVQAAMLVTPPPPLNQSRERAVAASTVQRHQAAKVRAAHVAHQRAVRQARERAAAAAAAAAQASASASASASAAATAAATSAAPAPTPTANAPPSPGGGYGTVLSYAQIEQVWVQAGGPASVEATAANIAECESGGNTRAYNTSGATGLFQILGQVVPGDLYDPLVNAENAVSKFNASGGTFAQWVCQG